MPRVGKCTPVYQASALIMIEIRSYWYMGFPNHRATLFPWQKNYRRALVYTCLIFPVMVLSEKLAQALSVSQMADFLSAWMSVVGIGSAVLVGNSLGCQVIAEMALRHPSRLYRAILIGPTVDKRRRTSVQQIVRTLRAGFYEDLSLIPKVLFDYALAGVRRSFQAMQYAINHEVEHLLPHMSVPTLVVRGSRDPLCPQRWAEEVNSLLPDGHLVIIPGGGHGVHYSLAGETAKVILDFLD
jgi:2-hydroxy-6-oxonona-2,4-dienedioate hydrolase